MVKQLIVYKVTNTTNTPIKQVNMTWNKEKVDKGWLATCFVSMTAFPSCRRIYGPSPWPVYLKVFLHLPQFVQYILLLLGSFHLSFLHCCHPRHWFVHITQPPLHQQADPCPNLHHDEHLPWSILTNWLEPVYCWWGSIKETILHGRQLKLKHFLLGVTLFKTL